MDKRGYPALLRDPAYAPGDIIPDGQGGVVTEWTDDMTDDPPLTVADISSSGGIQQADFSNLYGVLMSNRSADRSVDEDLVLGDNNTAFVTDGYSVTSFSPADLSQYWSYTTTGGTLSFVAANPGSTVTINDTQQGVIQLGSDGSASAPTAALAGTAPFQLGLPLLISSDGSSIGSWEGVQGGQTSFLAGLELAPAQSSYLEPQGSGENRRAAYYTADVSMKFHGGKSPMDVLVFPSTQTCSQSLGPFNCPSSSTGTWVWNVEISANVTGDATNWRPRQTLRYYSQAGQVRDSNGNLHVVGNLNNAVLGDTPDPVFTQRLPGMRTVYWLDAPGSRYYEDWPDDNYKWDSLTEIENFTSSACNPYRICTGIDWHLRLVIDPGSTLDYTQTEAGLGHVSQ